MIVNADLGEGEGAGRMRGLMSLVGAVNVACGGHAGDLGTMRRAIGLAQEFGVRLGAHPGVAGNFGRGSAALDAGALEMVVLQQVGGFAALVGAAGATLHHVKLHGSLYHLTEGNAILARRYCEVVRDVFPGVRIVALAGGRVEREGSRAGVPVWGELFADRGYGADGQLIPRGEPGALVVDGREIARRIAEWRAADWLGARTICVHGDGPDAVRVARVVARAIGAS